ncbi:hypothetical protein RIF29_23429 [Crotalaria pallida]|uniref:Peptidase A1 domain-containing protein n=1 Tax=Crotalaria pallida TaxID=3830 RepID=A0AAN9F7L6_CROPI
MTCLHYIAVLTFLPFLTLAQLFPPPFTPGISLRLKLIPALSSESPLYAGILSHPERIQKMIEISEARVQHLTSTLASKNSGLYSTNTLHHRRFYAYYTEISLGSPKQSQFLAVDAGTGLIWTQCQPCINCYNQTIPIYNPSTSTSYAKLQAGDPRCISDAPNPIFQRDCSYALLNPGESLTAGVASMETFTFPNDQGEDLSVKNILFGCSNNNSRMPFDGTGISGVIGLNTAPSSLGKQLGQLRSPSRFSYCLLPSSQPEQNGTSLLKFGDDAVIETGQEVQTTPIVKNSFSDYAVNLEGISVGNQRLKIPHRRNNTEGTFFDIGSMVTFMASNPYTTVMKKFDKHFKSVGRKRVTPPPETEGKFDYCYNYDKDFKDFVPMTYHLQGTADLKVDTSQMYIVIRDAFCVTIIPSRSFLGSEFTLVGALHQQNTRFVFDLDNNVVKFASEHCSQDQ